MKKSTRAYLILADLQWKLESSAPATSPRSGPDDVRVLHNDRGQACAADILKIEQRPWQRLWQWNKEDMQ